MGRKSKLMLFVANLGYHNPVYKLLRSYSFDNYYYFKACKSFVIQKGEVVNLENFNENVLYNRVLYILMKYYNDNTERFKKFDKDYFNSFFESLNKCVDSSNHDYRQLSLKLSYYLLSSEGFQLCRYYADEYINILKSLVKSRFFDMTHENMKLLIKKQRYVDKETNFKLVVIRDIWLLRKSIVLPTKTKRYKLDDCSLYYKLLKNIIYHDHMYFIKSMLISKKMIVILINPFDGKENVKCYDFYKYPPVFNFY